MTPRGRIIGLFAGLLGPSGAAGGALASTVEGQASRASSIQHAATSGHTTYLIEDFAALC